MKRKTIDIITLGCSKNLVDSEHLMRQLEEVGFHVTHDAERPKGQIAVINTCGFIGDAKEESINMILEFAQAKEEGNLEKLYVMGCLSERYLKELAVEIPQVDKFYGKFNWRELLQDLGKAYHDELHIERTLTTPKHYAYLKISEGCDRKCSYCAIPIITGRHVSRPMEEILDEVKYLVARGVKEFQVIAQELTYYGVDLYKKQMLPELVERISDIPGVRYTEGRFLPYFFPDTFYEGNDPCLEARENWLCARRALMRKPVDRIGYGGYLSLAYKFPKFVDYIEEVTDEFREIYEKIGGSKPYCGLKVAILNCWGRLRSWQAFMVAHALWYKQTYSYFGVLEALSGAGVDVTFLSFDEIIESGIPEEVDVIVNAGAAGTAFSGGDRWLEERLVTAVRKFVWNGGGFVGIGEPSAVHGGGRFFQLADVLGVDKELGFSLSTDKYFTKPMENHFLKEDQRSDFDFGESVNNVYALSEDTEIAEFSDGEVHLSAHGYGRGRGVYIAGLPYSHDNTRLLLRGLYYSGGREEEMKRWYGDNPLCEVHAYPEKGHYAVVNNSMEPQTTMVYDGAGKAHEVKLEGSQILWEKM